MMGMTVTVEVVDESVTIESIEKVFSYFTYVDETFSTYKDSSEISKINRGELHESDWSEDMKEVFLLSEKTKKESNGYFDIKRADGYIDPSGLVKGWAIRNAAHILDQEGYTDFYVDVGGDIEVRGRNSEGKYWNIGIKNPFNEKEIVKVVSLSNKGMATSGTYIRGQHIYNPHMKGDITDIISLTVIGSDVYEADRYATAAFAMGKQGIYFIEQLPGFEGYMIDRDGLATPTSGFHTYTHA